MVTIQDIISKAKELNATKYAYNFYNHKKTDINAIHFFRDDNKEVLCFTINFIDCEGFTLNSVFPNGRTWSQEHLNTLDNFRVLNDREYQKLDRLY